MFNYSDSDSEEQVDVQQAAVANAPDFGFSDSDEESSENRRVVSPLEKFDHKIKGLLSQMQDYSDQNNWSAAYDSFQKIGTLIKKKRNLIRVRGPPQHYLKFMNRFLDGLREAKKSDLVNTNAKNKKENAAKFTRFKNELKKGNIPFLNLLERYAKENDIWLDDIEDDASEDPEDSDDEDLQDKDVDGNDGDDDDSFEWSSDEEDTDPDEPRPDQRSGYTKPDMFNREFWLKKEFQPDTFKKATKTKKKGGRGARDREREKKRKLEKASKQIASNKKTETVWDDKAVRKLITNYLNVKGSVDRSDRRKFADTLKTADMKCTRPQWVALLKLLRIENILVLYTPPRCLKQKAWCTIVKLMDQLLDLLREHPEFRLHVRGLRKLKLTQKEKEMQLKKGQDTKKTDPSNSVFAHGLLDAENMLKAEQDFDDDKVEGLDDQYWWLRGNLHAICSRLSDDLILAFKQSGIKAEEYDSRVQDKQKLVDLCKKCRSYIHDITKHRMQELMFRHLFVQLKFEDYEASFDILGKESQEVYVAFKIPDDTEVLRVGKEIMDEVNIYDGLEEAEAAEKFGAEDTAEHQQYSVLKSKIKWENLLFVVHHIALHHRFGLARDILSASGLGKEQTMGKSEISIQILYNRTIARIAIAAFTQENWLTSMTLLQRLYITGKIKELLAQGVKTNHQWRMTKSPEEIAQEQQERQRMVPAHSFINQDLLESVHYISSLFFEMKAILQTGADEGRIINRSFRRQWEYRQKREFLAPPETSRDRILEAGAQMLKGKWEMCQHHLRSLKCWEEFPFADVVKEKVFRKVKRECLRCYLMSSSKHFSDIKLEKIAEQFDMSVAAVIKACSKFIIEQDIKASIDLPGGFLVIHEPLPTPFETAATGFDRGLSSFFSAIKETGDMFKTNSGGNRGRHRGFKTNSGGNRGAAGATNHKKKNTGGKWRSGF